MTPVSLSGGVGNEEEEDVIVVDDFLLMTYPTDAHHSIRVKEHIIAVSP